MKNYYFIVRSEYIHILKLHGVELHVFAVIDSCYRTGSRWKAGCPQLAYIVGSSTRSIERSITSLLDSGYITRLDDYSYIPSDSALKLLDDKMSEGKDKMSQDYDKMSRQIDEEEVDTNISVTTISSNNKTNKTINNQSLSESVYHEIELTVTNYGRSLTLLSDEAYKFCKSYLVDDMHLDPESVKYWLEKLVHIQNYGV